MPLLSGDNVGARRRGDNKRGACRRGDSIKMSCLKREQATAANVTNQVTARGLVLRLFATLRSQTNLGSSHGYA